MLPKPPCSKLIGYTPDRDRSTVVGLPGPIYESINTLKQHRHTMIVCRGPGTDEEGVPCSPLGREGRGRGGGGRGT